MPLPLPLRLAPAADLAGPREIAHRSSAPLRPLHEAAVSPPLHSMRAPRTGSAPYATRSCARAEGRTARYCGTARQLAMVGMAASAARTRRSSKWAGASSPRAPAFRRPRSESGRRRGCRSCRRQTSDFFSLRTKHGRDDPPAPLLRAFGGSDTPMRRAGWAQGVAARAHLGGRGGAVGGDGQGLRRALHARCGGAHPGSTGSCEATVCRCEGVRGEVLRMRCVGRVPACGTAAPQASSATRPSLASSASAGCVSCVCAWRRVSSVRLFVPPLERAPGTAG
jgi:hypothetical protein